MQGNDWLAFGLIQVKSIGKRIVFKFICQCGFEVCEQQFIGEEMLRHIKHCEEFECQE